MRAIRRINKNEKKKYIESLYTEKPVLFISGSNSYNKNGYNSLAKLHKQIMKNQYKDKLISLYFGGDPLNIDFANKDISIPADTFFLKVESLLRGTPLITNDFEDFLFLLIDKCKPRLIFFDDSTCGLIIKKIKGKYKDISVVSFFHDVEKQRMKDLMRYANIKDKILYLESIKNEEMTAEFANKTIVLNNRDAVLFEKIYGKKPDGIIPIVTKEISFDSCENHVEGENLNIVFIGVDYEPNVNGLRWFISNVMVGVKKHITLTVVGYHMENYKQEFERDNVKVIGTVDSLDSYYISADVVIAPIFEGGGMKVKTAEAFSYGKNFVGTPESLTGYWDSLPEKFKNKVVFQAESKEIGRAHV